MKRSAFFQSLVGLVLFRKPIERKEEWRCMYCHELFPEPEKPVPQKGKGIVFYQGPTVLTLAQEDRSVLEMPTEQRCEFCGCAFRVKVGGER